MQNKTEKGEIRPEGYNYLGILEQHLGGDLTKVFNGEMIYPRQLEIHLPADHKNSCNFHCSYCQGRILDHSLDPYEEKALSLLDELGERIPYHIYGGAYTEPTMNPSMMRFLMATKRNGATFGIHTNGSLLKTLEEKEGFLTKLNKIATSQED